MTDLFIEEQEQLFIITLNRVSKHNALDKALLIHLEQAIEQGIQSSHSRIILLKAKGAHFCAGADIAWMQETAQFNEEENQADAMVLARLMYTLSSSPKPTVSAIQGHAFGGGLGLVAASDIAIASTSARFCFSEVKLGLIPAVISPYVIKAIGSRASKALFMSAEVFDAHEAKRLGLIHHCVGDEELDSYVLNYLQKMTKHAPQAVKASKELVNSVAGQTIDESLLEYTASLIARRRVSSEGQRGLRAFLNKEVPNWLEDE